MELDSTFYGSYEQDDPAADYPWLLELGTELAHKPLSQASFSSYHTEFGKRFRGFEALNENRPVINAALAEPEPTDRSTPWRASQTCAMLATLSELSLARGLDHPRATEEQRAARNVSYRLAQIGILNIGSLARLAEHSEPSVHIPARQLIVHSEGLMPSFQDEEPHSIPYLTEVVKYERANDFPHTTLAPRYASILNTAARADNDCLTDAIEAFRRATPEPELLKAVADCLHNALSDNLSSASLEEIKILAEASAISTYGAEPNHEWQAKASRIIDSLDTAQPSIAKAIRHNFINISQKDPQVLGDIVWQLYGVSLYSLDTAWRDSLGNRYDDSISYYRKNNMDTIFELEEQHPGSTRYLEDHFRIRNFSRYPINVLRRQYETAIARDNNTGTTRTPNLTNQWFFADYDHSAAFASEPGKVGQLAQAAYAAGQDFEIHEVGSLEDIVSAIAHSPSPIGSICLTGHSNGYSTTLGRHTFVDQLDLQNIRRRFGSRATAQFAPDMTVVFDSCHTGRQYGIGETAASLFGVNVAAPLGATSLVGLDIGRQEQAQTTPLLIRPRYNNDVGRLIANTAKNT